MQDDVQYDEIDHWIRTTRPDIWRRLFPLHVFYKNEITQRIAENCEFLACFEETEQVAMDVVAWVETLPEDLVSGFNLLSQSYDELKQTQRITGQVLTRKANRLRRNLRRVLELSPERDRIQQSFDAEKLTASKTFIVVPDRQNPDTGLSAHDLRQWHLKKHYAVTLAIADSLHDFATGFLDYQGLFLTLTLPGTYHACSYEEAKAEISRRWKSVRRKAREKDILLLGMTALELQNDETPHYHIQLYVDPSQRAWLEEQILQAFPNEVDRQADAIKDIRDVLSVSRYLTKDYGKPETSLTFIGLTRDIRSRYTSIHAGKRYGTLSDARVATAHRLIKRKAFGGIALLLMRGFSDERLNRISTRHPDFHYVRRGMPRTLTALVHVMHFRTVKDFNASPVSQTSMVRHQVSVRTTVFHSDIVPACLDIYQEGVTSSAFGWERLCSRGQPPPKARDEALDMLEQPETSLSRTSPCLGKGAGSPLYWDFKRF
ncbi:replication endonuclease [Gluconobacter wancherniae]|uniref:replication endonuclease n=1 Tax=Gluconobacter wancherniae TaxID=1307955 RepID=UPI002012339F|nr:replication endonuclease [Gluconobacter wancherniae]